jgi:hypothetical protein
MIKEEFRSAGRAGVQEFKDARRQMTNDRFSGEIKEECRSSEVQKFKEFKDGRRQRSSLSTWLASNSPADCLKMQGVNSSFEYSEFLHSLKSLNSAHFCPSFSREPNACHFLERIYS